MYDMELSLYNRQEMIKLNKIDTMVVIGCGGIGSNLAFKANMIGVTKFVLIDYDAVSYSNLSRTPFTIEDINQPKTTALSKHLRLYRDIGFDTLYLTEFKHKVNNTDLSSLEDLIDSKEDLRKEFERVNSPVVVNCINPKTMQMEYQELLLDINENADKYLIVDTTDNYLQDSEFDNNPITLLSDYKLNYDGTQISVLSNPYATKRGTLSIPIDQMRVHRGYSTVPSFFLSPDILVSAFLMYILKRKEGIRHKDTIMFNVELEDFLSSIFNLDNVIKYI